MGACGSSAGRVAVESGGAASSYAENERAVSSKVDVTATVVDELYDLRYSATYAFVSQRGYYPHQLRKPNQDAYVCQHLNRDGNAFLMGVFDGHGAEGDLCAQFAAKKLAHCLEREVGMLLKKGRLSGRVCELYDPRDATPKLTNLFARAFQNANLLMHAASFDTQLSGTTAVCALVVGGTLVVGNVGDSRAILGFTPPDGDVGAIAVEALSVDQTPYREDERERVKKYGARIMTVDQVEGKEPLHENWGTRLGDEIDEYGDPPRVWNDTLERPGCAFTRSLGDMVAERLGVVADPELTTHRLRPEDNFVVIASDGVFEFITSQAVADMVNRIRLSGAGPLEACRRVVAESYRLWLQYEVRSDDITMVCIFFDNLQPVAAASTDDVRGPMSEKMRGVRAALAAEAPAATRLRAASTSGEGPSREVRPVRRVLAKEKRVHLNMSESQRLDPAEVVEFQSKLRAYAKPKSADEEKRIEAMTRSNYLFLNLTEDRLSQMVSVMQKERFSAGDVIMRAGDEGDKFYLIDSGEYDVIIRDATGANQTVHSYKHAGESFGELSLMYGKPRAATIRCTAEGQVWTLNRLAFRACLMKPTSNASLVATLSKVEGFKQLAVPQLQRISDACTSETFTPGSYIITQGAIGQTFYVVSEGEVVVTKTPPEAGAPEIELVRLGANAFFGERALLHDEPRAANVKASEKGPVKCVVVERSIFREVMAEVGATLERAHATRVTEQESLDAQGGAHHSRFVAAKGGSVEQKVSTLDARRLEATYLGCPVKPEAGFFGIHALVLAPPESGSRRVSIKWSGVADSCASGRVKGLLRERDILTSLRDASTLVPHVLATEVDDRAACLVTAEFIVGDLHAFLENDFDESAVAFYAACVVEALEYLHAEKVLVRNVTSEGILLRSDGYAMVGDLERATRLTAGKDEKAYTMCGDPLYFAPEMIGGGAGYSYPVDFWALGVLMFEMFTARLPFGAPGAGETAVYAAIAKGDFDAPKDAPPALADAWAVLLKQEYSRANAIDLRHHALFKNNVDLDRLKDRSAEPPFRALVDNRARSLIAADGTLGAFDDFRGGLAKAASSNVWQFRSY